MNLQLSTNPARTSKAPPSSQQNRRPTQATRRHLQISRLRRGSLAVFAFAVVAAFQRSGARGRTGFSGWALREGNSRRGGSGERASGRSAEETSSANELRMLYFLADREAIRNVLLWHGLRFYLFTYVLLG